MTLAIGKQVDVAAPTRLHRRRARRWATPFAVADVNVLCRATTPAFKRRGRVLVGAMNMAGVHVHAKCRRRDLCPSPATWWACCRSLRPRAPCSTASRHTLAAFSAIAAIRSVWRTKSSSTSLLPPGPMLTIGNADLCAGFKRQHQAVFVQRGLFHRQQLKAVVAARSA